MSERHPHLEVLGVGAQVTVQDAGRPGYSHLGVPRSGALDRPAHDLAQRLVGNGPAAAGLEVLLGGLRVRVSEDRWVAMTGAPCELRIDGRAQAHGRAVRLPAGATLSLGTPAREARSYLAVAGGVACDPVLGSRSTDTLAGLGPAPLQQGDRLPLGRPQGPPAEIDAHAPRPDAPLALHRGPRADWCAEDPVTLLAGGAWRVASDSDRIGLRLDGQPLSRSITAELPSEGLVSGAVQLPPSGRPIVFLADHPTTGGYPVVAVVDPADLWRCAQLRPGDPVSFRRAR